MLRYQLCKCETEGRGKEAMQEQGDEGAGEDNAWGVAHRQQQAHEPCLVEELRETNKAN